MQSDQRKTATFSRQGKALTVFDGVQRVLDELQRLGVHHPDRGGSDERMAEIIRARDEALSK